MIILLSVWLAGYGVLIYSGSIKRLRLCLTQAALRGNECSAAEINVECGLELPANSAFVKWLLCTVGSEVQSLPA